MDINLTEKERIREQVYRQQEEKKIKIYGLKKTEEERAVLEKALSEFALHNKTDIKCPRCGSELELIEKNASYELKCLNNGICIKIVSRGI